MRDFVVLGFVFGIIVGYAIGVLKNNDLKGSWWNENFNLFCIIIAGCFVCSGYFPIQNFEKILFNKSSLLTSPVIKSISFKA